MSDNKDPLDNEISVEGSLTHTGAKAKVRSRFVSAIDRLLGNAVDAGNLYVEKHVSRERAIMEAQRKMIEAAGDAVAEQIKADPELAERALGNHFRDILRKQSNKEAVVLVAREELKQLPPPDSIGNDSEQQGDTLDEDWLAFFEQSAERVSSEQMQHVFGRILAGQINKPGTFSRSTLRVVSELDQKTAEMFVELAKCRIGVSIPKEVSGIDFGAYLALDAAGLINSAGGALSLQLQPDAEGNLRIPGKEYGLHLVPKAKGAKFIIPVAPLTPVGMELATLVEPDDLKAFHATVELTTRDLKYAAIHKLMRVNDQLLEVPGPPFKTLVTEEIANPPPTVKVAGGD
jgi:hypothetical protein